MRCWRRWAAAVPEGWVEPFCPICGAWPALAEVRGIERSRYFRCLRCGAGWHHLFDSVTRVISVVLGVDRDSQGALVADESWKDFLFEVGLVATLQAFIFVMLTVIYLAGAVAVEHHEDEAHGAHAPAHA